METPPTKGFGKKSRRVSVREDGSEIFTVGQEEYSQAQLQNRFAKALLRQWELSLLKPGCHTGAQRAASTTNQGQQMFKHCDMQTFTCGSDIFGKFIMNRSPENKNKASISPVSAINALQKHLQSTQMLPNVAMVTKPSSRITSKDSQTVPWKITRGHLTSCPYSTVSKELLLMTNKKRRCLTFVYYSPKTPCFNLCSVDFVFLTPVKEFVFSTIHLWNC